MLLLLRLVLIEGFDNTTGFFPDSVGASMKSPFKFSQHGECGKYVSDIFPHLSQHVDKMAFIHSNHTQSNNHSPALFMMNSGMRRMGFPCVGSWLTYGLGTENQDLPAFVVMSDPLGRGLPKGHSQNWSSGFLPSVYQGPHLRSQGDPIENLSPPAAVSGNRQRAMLDLIGKLGKHHMEDHPAVQELAARMKVLNSPIACSPHRQKRPTLRASRSISKSCTASMTSDASMWQHNV